MESWLSTGNPVPAVDPENQHEGEDVDIGQPSEHKSASHDSGDGSEVVGLVRVLKVLQGLSLSLFLFLWSLQLKKGKKVVMGWEYGIQNFIHFPLQFLLLLKDLNILLENSL